MPVGWIAHILRVIKKNHRHRLAVDGPGQVNPLAARSPDGVAFNAFAADVFACYPRIVQGRNLGSYALGISKDFGLIRRMLEFPCYADGNHTLLVVFENYVLIQRLQRGYVIDRAVVCAGPE